MNMDREDEIMGYRYLRHLEFLQRFGPGPGGNDADRSAGGTMGVPTANISQGAQAAGTPRRINHLIGNVGREADLDPFGHFLVFGV